MRPTSAHSGLRGPPLNLCDIIQRGYLSQVHLLVSLGVDLESRDALGRSPLMLTAFVQPEGWGVGVARLLIEQGVRMNPRDKHGMNALHHACIYERIPLARVLLNAPDFDLVQCDRFGNTALHYAAMSGNATLVKLIVSYHHRFRHPLTKANRKGHTARDKALYCGHHLCLAILDESTSASGQSKDGGYNHSECESTPPVFIMKEESVSNEDVKAVSTIESKMGEEAKTENEDLKLSLRREDEEGGLFRAGNRFSQEDLSPKNLLSPYHTPPTSDRSSDLKGSRGSQNTSPRMRRSEIRRAQPPAILRRMSAGSSSSNRSASSAQKQPLPSPQSSNGPTTTNNNTTTTNNNNTTTTTTTNNNNNNNNIKNGTNQSPRNTENELAAESTGEPIITEILRRTSKTPSLKSLKMNSVLSKNTPILNYANTNNETSHTLSRPPTKLSGIQSLRGGSGGRDPTFLTRTSFPLPLPYERNPERVIHVASEHDFRNTREYVLKLTRVQFSPAHFVAESLPLLVRRPPLGQPEEDCARKANSATGSWRNNIRFLYRHLEHQCSPSWRYAAQPPPEPLMMIPQWGVTSPTGDEVDEGKEKKVRRPSSSSRPVGQMNDVSTCGNVKQRKTSTNRQRKTSAVSPPSGVARGEGGQQGDNLTTSSSDSVSTGSKKKQDTRPEVGPNRPQ
ncbi:hypothetical protein ACOMHN_051733 [Nucella lapillus]